jgi:hypothetical protein
MDVPNFRNAAYRAWMDLREQSEALQKAGFASEEESSWQLDDIDPRDSREAPPMVRLPDHERQTLHALAQSYRIEEAIQSQNTGQDDDGVIDPGYSYDAHIKKIALARATRDEDQLLDAVEAIWDDLLDVRSDVADVMGSGWVRATSPYNHQLLERTLREATVRDIGLEPPDGRHEDKRWPSEKSLHASKLEYDYHRLAGISVNRPRSHRKRDNPATPTVRTLAKMAAGLETHPALLFFDDDLLDSLVELARNIGDIENEIEEEKERAPLRSQRSRKTLVDRKSGDDPDADNSGRFHAEFGSETERRLVSRASDLAERIDCRSVGGVAGAAIGLVRGVPQAVLLAHLFDGMKVPMPEPFRLTDFTDWMPKHLLASPPEAQH